MGAAAVTAAVVAIAFVVFLVARHVWRSDPPRAAIGGIRCHWNGRYLIARGVVVNVGDRGATFDIEPDIAVSGRGSLTSREDDFVAVRAGARRPWRWTNGHAGVPSGTAVTRCSASIVAPRRGGEPGD